MKRDGEDGAKGADQRGAVGAAAGGVGAGIVATLAGACCVGPSIAPIFVSVLGAGGAAWAAGLKPYSFYILGAALLPLIYGFYSLHRRPSLCSEGVCAPPPRSVPLVLRVASGLWVASLGANVAFRILSP